MNCKYTMFSPMKWLDEKIEQNRKSEGRNVYSDGYYGYLLKIRNAQESGEISDLMFDECSIYMCQKPKPEYGYYTANIHYDMHYLDDEDDELLELRLLDFLEKSDPVVLRHNTSLKCSIMNDLRYHIRVKNHIDFNLNDESLSNENIIDTIGNKLEKEIQQIYFKIYPKRPIIDKVEFEFYDENISLYKMYCFDVYNQFNLTFAPLTKDGKALHKKGTLKKYVNIDADTMDEYFTKLYPLLDNKHLKTDKKRKDYPKFLNIRVINTSKTLNYQYVFSEIEKFISFLKEVLNNDYI